MGFSDTPLSGQPAPPGPAVPPPPPGEQGTSFLTGLLQQGSDPSKAEVFNQGANQFKDLAANGGFAVNEEAMQDYINLCTTFEDGYNARRRDLLALTRRLPLGSSPYAIRVADHNTTVATGDDRSLMHNLELLADGFRKMREGFQLARRNYHDNEAAQTMRRGAFGSGEE